jgi:anti-anti-sigma factor
MNFKLEQQQQYAVIEFNDTVLDANNATDFETIVRNLFRKGYNNMVLELGESEDIDGHGVAAIRKANKICQNEAGLFVVVTKNPDIIERLDGAKILDLTIMPTKTEAVDAIFLNELENDFEDGEGDDEDYGFDEFTEGSEGGSRGGGSDDDY